MAGVSGFEPELKVLELSTVWVETIQIELSSLCYKLIEEENHFKLN